MMRWKPSVPNGVSGSGMSVGWVASLMSYSSATGTSLS